MSGYQRSHFQYQRITVWLALFLFMLLSSQAITIGGMAQQEAPAGAVAAPPAAASAPSGAAAETIDKDANQTCPVLTDQEIDPKFYTEYHGRRVYLCCDRCLRKFKADPQKYAANLPPIYATPVMAAVVGAVRTSGQAASAGERLEDMPHFLSWLGKFHPLIVHFPIALILSAFLAELLFMRTDNDFFAKAGRYCLWIGGIGAICAGAAGWLFGGFHLVDKDWILTTHRWVGTATVLVTIVLLWIAVIDQKRKTRASTALYRAALLIATVLVSTAGFFGGSLVYGIDHLKW